MAVDFTVHEVALANLGWLAEHGIHAVVGTTGFSESDLAQIASGLARPSSPTAWWCPTSPSQRC